MSARYNLRSGLSSASESEYNPTDAGIAAVRSPKTSRASTRIATKKTKPDESESGLETDPANLTKALRITRSISSTAGTPTRKNASKKTSADLPTVETPTTARKRGRPPKPKTEADSIIKCKKTDTTPANSPKQSILTQESLSIKKTRSVKTAGRTPEVVLNELPQTPTSTYRNAKAQSAKNKAKAAADISAIGQFSGSKNVDVLLETAQNDSLPKTYVSIIEEQKPDLDLLNTSSPTIVKPPHFDLSELKVEKHTKKASSDASKNSKIEKKPTDLNSLDQNLSSENTNLNNIDTILDKSVSNKNKNTVFPKKESSILPTLLENKSNNNSQDSNSKKTDEISNKPTSKRKKRKSSSNASTPQGQVTLGSLSTSSSNVSLESSNIDKSENNPQIKNEIILQDIQDNQPSTTIFSTPTNQSLNISNINSTSPSSSATQKSSNKKNKKAAKKQSNLSSSKVDSHLMNSVDLSSTLSPTENSAKKSVKKTKDLDVLAQAKNSQVLLKCDEVKKIKLDQPNLAKTNDSLMTEVPSLQGSDLNKKATDTKSKNNKHSIPKKSEAEIEYIKVDHSSIKPTITAFSSYSDNSDDDQGPEIVSTKVLPSNKNLSGESTTLKSNLDQIDSSLENVVNSLPKELENKLFGTNSKNNSHKIFDDNIQQDQLEDLDTSLNASQTVDTNSTSLDPKSSILLKNQFRQNKIKTKDLPADAIALLPDQLLSNTLTPIPQNTDNSVLKRKKNKKKDDSRLSKKKKRNLEDIKHSKNADFKVIKGFNVVNNAPAKEQNFGVDANFILKPFVTSNNDDSNKIVSMKDSCLTISRLERKRVTSFEIKSKPLRF
ncbi:hypothetical protein BB561_003927 [Smittium simulii]|uniref:Uncharacterized protein n=1 Tax=Smittium simulii TaxID=133385 RepID=A0A2T9YIY1_9FUNG|nr:hypothetical protein BB561_003927 [Smittium simulii]